MSKHFISQSDGKKMIQKFKEEKEKLLKDEYKDKDILPFSETFERAAFDRLLSQPGCIGIRVYYAMDKEQKVNLVVMGTDENGQDILPADAKPVSMLFASASNEASQNKNIILANAGRCPPDCPPPPPPPPVES